MRCYLELPQSRLWESCIAHAPYYRAGAMLPPSRGEGATPPCRRNAGCVAQWRLRCEHNRPMKTAKSFESVAYIMQEQSRRDRPNAILTRWGRLPEQGKPAGSVCFSLHRYQKVPVTTLCLTGSLSRGAERVRALPAAGH